MNRASVVKNTYCLEEDLSSILSTHFRQPLSTLPWDCRGSDDLYDMKANANPDICTIK